MRYGNEWHLDDEGRLHRAIVAHEKVKSDWTGMPEAQTRAHKLADRISNGFVVVSYLTAAVVMGGFALISLGYIEAPNSKQPAVEQVLPNVGEDIGICQK